MKHIITLILSSFITLSSFADTSTNWLEEQYKISWQKLLANLSPTGTDAGAVVASPSRSNPDYWYHWVRDAGLVMDVVATEFLEKKDPALEARIWDYIRFSHKIQGVATLTNLGEPKYYVDGTAFNGPWGRPQNDSPALRALSLIDYTHYLLDENRTTEVDTWLYKAELPASTIIKRDLEYIAHHWHESSFDLWEEVKGQHLYTLMTIHHALNKGAILAERMFDKAAAAYYTLQAIQVAQRLENFKQHGQLVTTLDRTEGIDYKHSQLDTAQVLAILHTKGLGYFTYSTPELARSIELMEDSFTREYAINQRGMVSTLYGRYPEDRYYGGNPWILTTLAIAEWHYKLAAANKSQNEFDYADALLERIRLHSHLDGSMTEQLDRHTGYHIAAPDLTWSHASYITAVKARLTAKKKQLR